MKVSSLLKAILVIFVALGLSLNLVSCDDDDDIIPVSQDDDDDDDDDDNFDDGFGGGFGGFGGDFYEDFSGSDSDIFSSNDFSSKKGDDISDFIGTYKTRCTKGDNHENLIKQYVVTDSQVLYTETVYDEDDKECHDPLFKMEKVATILNGSYRSDDDYNGTHYDEATIPVRIISAKIIPLSEEGLDYLKKSEDGFYYLKRISSDNFDRSVWSNLDENASGEIDILDTIAEKDFSPAHEFSYTFKINNTTDSIRIDKSFREGRSSGFTISRDSYERLEN